MQLRLIAIRFKVWHQSFNRINTDNDDDYTERMLADKKSVTPKRPVVGIMAGTTQWVVELCRPMIHHLIGR